jgi:hypothetical protein
MNSPILRSVIGTVALFSLLLMCGELQTTGGGGTETVNTFALLSNGSPASGAVVRVIDATGWIDSVRAGSSAVIETAVTDKDGRFSLTKGKHDSLVNIQIDHSMQGLFLSCVKTRAFDGDTVRLQQYASYAGTFAGSSAPVTSVLLSGSAYFSATGTGQGFAFDKVAPGSYLMLGVAAPSPQVATIDAITVTAGSATADTGLNASFDRLLIDNFECGIGPTSLGLIFPNASSWYAISESGKLEWSKAGDVWTRTSFTTPGNSPTCHSLISMDPAAGRSGGSSLMFSTALDNSCTIYYTAAGISFRPLNPRGIDLSSMTGFSLNVRGNGLLWIRFETRNLDSVTNHLSNYSWPVRLTGTWQSLQVPVDSLRILPAVQSPGLFPWASESHNVIDIEFEFSGYTNAIGDTVHLYLDNFILNGAGIDNLNQ